MKRRHSITKAPNQTTAMPIPGRVKIGVGGNMNKRHHWAPPSPQFNTAMYGGVVLGMPVPRMLQTTSKRSDNMDTNASSGSFNGLRKGSTSPVDMNISPLRPQRKSYKQHQNQRDIMGVSKNAMDMEEHKLNATQPGQQNKTQRRRIGLSDFERIRVLGKGAFGKVLLVRNKQNKRIYAMKILKKNHVINKRQVAHTMSERHVLGRSKHPFVVQMHCAFQTVDKLIFVLDYCAGGDLYYHISRNGRLTEPRCKF